MQILRVFYTSWGTSFPVFPIADLLSCWVLLFCIGRSGCACLSAEFLGCSRHPQGWWLLGIHRSIDSIESIVQSTLQAWHSKDSYHTHLTWGASCRTLSDSECEGAWNSNWSILNLHHVLCLFSFENIDEIPIVMSDPAVSGWSSLVTSVQLPCAFALFALVAKNEATNSWPQISGEFFVVSFLYGFLCRYSFSSFHPRF